MIESMSVVDDPTTNVLVNNEAVSAKLLADGIEGMSPVRRGPTSGGLRLNGGQRLYPKNWAGTTPLSRFARQEPAWPEYIDYVHKAADLLHSVPLGYCGGYRTKTRCSARLPMNSQ